MITYIILYNNILIGLYIIFYTILRYFTQLYNILHNFTYFTQLYIIFYTIIYNILIGYNRSVTTLIDNLKLDKDYIYKLDKS